MNVRKALAILSIAAAAAPAAFAGNFVGGELGYESHPAAGPITRAQVQQDYQAFRAHPVSADGTVFIQGEAGYVSANQGVSADNVPARPHTHALGNSAARVTQVAPAPMSESERRAYRDQYVN